MFFKQLRFLLLLVLVLSMLFNVSFASAITIIHNGEVKEFEKDITILNDHDLLTVRKTFHSIPDYEAVRTSLATMKKVDLNGDGKMDIAALINFQGTTANPFEVFLVYSVQDKFVTQRLHTRRAIMEKTVVDLNDDGMYEICVNSRILGGHTPIVLAVEWVDIYSWDGHRYTQHNEQFFESFYLHRYLPQLSKRLDDAGMRLDLDETRSTISSVLEDCRTALEKMSSMSTTETFQKRLPTLRNPVDPESVRDDLSSISAQLVRTQELLRQNAQNEEIRSVLQASQKLLQQMSRTSDGGK